MVSSMKKRDRFLSEKTFLEYDEYGGRLSRKRIRLKKKKNVSPRLKLPFAPEEGFLGKSHA